MLNIEGTYLVNVFDSDSNISEKGPQDQGLFEDANQDDDQITVSSDGSVSLPNSDLNESADSIGIKEDEVEVDGNRIAAFLNFSEIHFLRFRAHSDVSQENCYRKMCFLAVIIVRKIYV